MVYSFICDIRNKKLNTAALLKSYSRRILICFPKIFNSGHIQTFSALVTLKNVLLIHNIFFQKKNAVSFIIPSDFRDTNELIYN